MSNVRNMSVSTHVLAGKPTLQLLALGLMARLPGLRGKQLDRDTVQENYWVSGRLYYIDEADY